MPLLSAATAVHLGSSSVNRLYLGATLVFPGAGAGTTSVQAGHAAGTGTAYNATVNVDGATLASAGKAAGTGSAYGATVRIGSAAGKAAGTGSAYGATVTTSGVETFTGTNGTLPAGWTADLPDGGSASIQSNALQVTSPAIAYTAASASRSGVVDGELLVSVTLASTVEHYPLIGVRAAAAFASAGYAVQLWPADSAIKISEYAAGNDTPIASAAFTFAANTYKVRFRWQGSSLQARVWLSTDSEPGTWTVTTTDSTVTAADKIILGVLSGAASTARTVTYDDLTVTAL